MFQPPIPYFSQTKSWSEFWLSVNNKSHQIYKISLKQDNIELNCLVYEYPWYFGLKLFHVPQGPILTKMQNAKLETFQTSDFKLKIFEAFLVELERLAVKQNAAFTKLDFDPSTLDYLKLENKANTLQYLKKASAQKVRSSSKILMYGATYFLDLNGLKLQNESDSELLDVSKLADFMKSNNDFWLGRSKDIRNSTRRSLEQDWHISIAKTEPNLDAFWEVFQATQKRQNFAGHSKEYFETFLQNEHSRIIILRDEQNQAHSAWFGWESENYITYLHGGNTQHSFTKFGQYLIHLCALYICTSENKQYYDMGGYVYGSGFANFKDKYKGQVVDFAGPFDIVYKPFVYEAVNGLIKIIKLFRS